jgi:hypothetical protein
MTLPEIARLLRDRAAYSGKASWQLSRGLVLDLYCRAQPDGQLWLLALSREDVPVSTAEIQTCRRAFEVPATASELTTNRLTSICWIERPTEDVALVDTTPSVTQVALL